MKVATTIATVAGKLVALSTQGDFSQPVLSSSSAWPTIGQASLDDGKAAIEKGQWVYALHAFGVASAIFEPFHILLLSLENLMIATMDVSINVRTASAIVSQFCSCP